MRNKKWRIAIGILIVVILTVIVAIVLKQKQSPAVGINLISPVYGTIQTSISTTATVTPENRLEIRPPVNGRVDKILVKEGDYVKIGQTNGTGCGFRCCQGAKQGTVGVLGRGV